MPELIDQYKNVSLKDLKLLKIERELFASYRKDPLKWYVERFKGKLSDFIWTEHDKELYSKHKWDGDKNPLALAWSYAAKGDWVGIESCSASGKTYMLARLVFWFLDVYPDSLVVTSAPKHQQLKDNLWAEIGRAFVKFKKIRPNAELFAQKLKVDNRPEKNRFNDEEEDLQSAWQAVQFICGVTASQDTATKAQGYHRENMLIILEECAGMPNQIMNSFINTSTGANNLLFAVGNPDSESDTLHRFVTSRMERVKCIRISAYDFPNVVLKKEIIGGAVTGHSIKLRKDRYGETSNIFQSRVRGISPKQSVDSLIRLEWIEQCVQKDVVGLGEYHNAVGVDVAQSEEGDKASLVFGRGARLELIQEFQCPNATHLAYNVIYDTFELEQKGYLNYKTAKLKDFDVGNNCIGVDSVGVGVATLNAFNDLGYQATGLAGGEWKEAIPKDEKELPIYKFPNLRTQMYWELREDLRQGNLGIWIDDNLMLEQMKFELCIPKVNSTSNYIVLESKEQIKRRMGGKSPNVADAIAYWNWMRKGYKIASGIYLDFTAG